MVIKTTCGYCRKPITKYVTKEQRHYFCNRECYGKFYEGKPHWWTSNPTGKKGNRENKVPRIIVHCLNCGISFKKLETSSQKFCSRNCVTAYRRTGQSKVEIVCKNCGKEFEVLGSKTGRKYCSKKCYYEDERKFSQIYAGYSTKFPSNWGEKVRSVREKSGDMCPLCGSGRMGINNRPFSVHHKIPPRYFITNPEKAHDYDNLIAICYSCHTRIDRRYSPQKQIYHPH